MVRLSNFNNYLVFKEDKQWDSWKHSTISTARAHGCQDVFNPGYTPQGAAAPELFDEKQKFIYSVFESVLKTDMGKYFVRQHESDYNAQAIFRKLKQHALSSTQASLDSSTLLTYLTSARLDSKWRGTAHAFILNWCNKLRTYVLCTCLVQSGTVYRNRIARPGTSFLITRNESFLAWFLLIQTLLLLGKQRL